MALLNHQIIDDDGLAVAFAAADVGGDTYKLDDDGSTLLVKNDDAAAKTVTLVVPGTYRGIALPNRAVNVPAGAVVAVPLPRGLYREPSDGLVAVVYSAVTSLFVAVVRRG